MCTAPAALLSNEWVSGSGVDGGGDDEVSDLMVVADSWSLVGASMRVEDENSTVGSCWWEDRPWCSCIKDVAGTDSASFALMNERDSGSGFDNETHSCDESLATGTAFCYSSDQMRIAKNTWL